MTTVHTVLGKRRRSNRPSSGPGPFLRRAHIGRSLFMVTPAHVRGYRQRRGFRRWRGKSTYQRNRSRYTNRRKYPRAGGRSIAMRPTFGSVRPFEVKRLYVEGGHQAWPQKSAVDVNPARSPVYVPYAFQSWQRGIGDNRFTGSKVTLKNISVMCQINAPKTQETVRNIPYRIRFVAGWCKQTPLVQMSDTSSVALGGDFPNGMGINVQVPSTVNLIYGPQTPLPPHIQMLMLKLSDTVGVNGSHQNEASFPQSQFQIISDQIIRMAPETEVPGAAGTVDRQFKPVVRKINFTCNKQLKLLPMTTNAESPPEHDAEWYTPVNQPGTWIPFVTCMLLNDVTDFNNRAQLPTIKFSENAFWLDN